MISDLVGKGSLSREGYIVVIGAGTVGLPTSVMLARKTGAKIICLETGGAQQEKDTHPLNKVVELGTPNKGASQRFRCLGGTSTRWGGALIPFQDADLHPAKWPISLTELEPFISDVEELFSLEPGAYSDITFPFDLGKLHVNRMAKWPHFKKRNVATLCSGEAKSLSNLEVWLNSHVISIAVTEQSVRLVAASRSGDRINVDAKKLIIAAGAIETTRLALLIQRQNRQIMKNDYPALGRYFTDHVSAEVAEITATHSNTLNRIIGFRFGNRGSMRNVRFELSPETTVRDTLPPSFSHIGFRVTKPGGFDVLREIFQHLQRRKVPALRTAVDLAANTPWLLRAMWWRFVDRRLLFPQYSRLVVHVVIEQLPSQNHYIRLSDQQTDEFGVPLAEISWSVTDADKQNLLATAELFKTTWQSSKFAKMGAWKSFKSREVLANLENPEGICHPTGSTRMGFNQTDGVVDKNLNLFGVPNVQLLATSVLPTGGGANPTMMLFLLAMRCVDQHQKILNA
jgi:choline dehydrogenase-like flavoprotein